MGTIISHYNRLGNDCENDLDRTIVVQGLFLPSNEVGIPPAILHCNARDAARSGVQTRGVWGPAAKRFFKRCVAQADNQDRDVDLYHWSSAKFASTWRDTLSVLVARGRAQVGVHSAKTDWSRRILDFQYMDYDDQAAHHA